MRHGIYIKTDNELRAVRMEAVRHGCLETVRAIDKELARPERAAMMVKEQVHAS